MYAFDDSKNSLTPVRQLPGEWIYDYLGESSISDVNEIAHWAVSYPSNELIPFRVVFSSVDRSLLKKRLEESEIALAFTDYPQQSGVNPRPSKKMSDRREEKQIKNMSESFAKLVLPNFDKQIESSDAYYAHLLQAYPERLLVTIDCSHLANKSGTHILFAMATHAINSGVTDHYRAKYQTGAYANVNAMSGSVTLAMWRGFWNTSRHRWQIVPIGSQLSVNGGVQQPPLSHRGVGGAKSSYDANVTGWVNGSQYLLQGGWRLG